jgi:hypothetical protein
LPFDLSQSALVFDRVVCDNTWGVSDLSCCFCLLFARFSVGLSNNNFPARVFVDVSKLIMSFQQQAVNGLRYFEDVTLTLRLFRWDRGKGFCKGENEMFI